MPASDQSKEVTSDFDKNWEEELKRPSPSLVCSSTLLSKQDHDSICLNEILASFLPVSKRALCVRQCILMVSASLLLLIEGASSWLGTLSQGYRLAYTPLHVVTSLPWNVANLHACLS